MKMVDVLDMLSAVRINSTPFTEIIIATEGQLVFEASFYSNTGIIRPYVNGSKISKGEFSVLNNVVTFTDGLVVGDLVELEIFYPLPLFDVEPNPDNETPVVPSPQADDSANTMAFTHVLPDSEILISINYGAFVPYTGAINVGDVSRPIGYYRAKIKSATERNESAIAGSPAFTEAVVENTTPVAPGVSGDDTNNTLTFTHALSSEIVVSVNNGSFLPYTGQIAVGNVARAAGFYRAKIKAATGRDESALTNSPAFTVSGDPSSNNSLTYTLPFNVS
jgi:hypothetical protein